jgi:hypothetical protein
MLKLISWGSFFSMWLLENTKITCVTCICKLNYIPSDNIALECNSEFGVTIVSIFSFPTIELPEFCVTEMYSTLGMTETLYT